MKNISQAEWQELTANNPDAIIIDVRTEGEFVSGQLENAINIDIFETGSFIHKIEAMDKSKEYFLYCRSGQRSANACRLLESSGISKVYNLSGGIMSWTRTVV